MPTKPVTTATQTRKTTLHAPCDATFNLLGGQGYFHYLPRLCPPWQHIRDVRVSAPQKTGEHLLEFTLKEHCGPSFKWAMHVERDKENKRIRHTLTKGPFQSWQHVINITPCEEGCVLEETIFYHMKGRSFWQKMHTREMKNNLEQILTFRACQLEADASRLGVYATKTKAPLKIAITGSHGLLGGHLSRLLKAAGHQVFPIVREKSEDENQIYWNPDAGEIDTTHLEALKPDGIIHLAGENVAHKKWTQHQKDYLLSNRNAASKTICTAIAHMKHPPSVFLLGSAIGYYGIQDGRLTESSLPGSAFMSRIAQAIEEPAQTYLMDSMDKKGLRTVVLRTGVVLSPQGGALKRMLLPFRMGLGGKMGDGKQYISWISLDDWLFSALHCLHMEALKGPVNLTAPTPSTNAAFSKALGNTLRRPTVLPMPAFMVRALFGQMGDELLLKGSAILPATLQKSGFNFRFPTLEEAFKHLL